MLLHLSQLFKTTSVRQVVLDQWFPLASCVFCPRPVRARLVGAEVAQTTFGRGAEGEKTLALEEEADSSLHASAYMMHVIHV